MELASTPAPKATSCPKCDKLNSDIEAMHSYSPVTVLRLPWKQKTDKLKYVFEHFAHLDEELVEAWTSHMKVDLTKDFYTQYIECGSFNAFITLCTQYRGRPYMAAYGFHFMSGIQGPELSALTVKWLQHPQFFDILIHYNEYGVYQEQQHALLVTDHVLSLSGYPRSPEFHRKHLTRLVIAYEKLYASTAANFLAEIRGEGSWQMNAMNAEVRDCERYAPRYTELNKETGWRSLSFVTSANLHNYTILKQVLDAHPRLLDHILREAVAETPEEYPNTDKQRAVTNILSNLLDLPPGFEFFPESPVVEYIDTILDMKPTIVPDLLGALQRFTTKSYEPLLFQQLKNQAKHLLSYSDGIEESTFPSIVHENLIGAPVVALLDALWSLSFLPRTWSQFKVGLPLLQQFMENCETEFTRVAAKAVKGWLTNSHQQCRYASVSRDTEPVEVYKNFSSVWTLLPCLVHRLERLSVIPKQQVSSWESLQTGLAGTLSKEYGNEAFRQRRYVDAIFNYTEAILVAEAFGGSHAKDLAIYYGNRSVVYLAQDKPFLAELDAVKSLQLAPNNDKFKQRLAGIRQSIASGKYTRPYYFKPLPSDPAEAPLQ